MYFSSPKGAIQPQPGAAPQVTPKPIQALKGRSKVAKIRPPFQGFPSLLPTNQGVAMGYGYDAPLGLNTH